MGAGQQEEIRNRAELPEPRGSTGIETLESRTSESVQAIYSPPGGHFVAYGGNSLGGRSSLPAASSFGFAPGGLSHNSSSHVLPRSKSHRDGLLGDDAAGTAIWPGSGPEPDDVHQFVRGVADHAPICAGPQYRRRGAASPSRHQRCDNISARQSSESADLQQDEPGGYACPYTRVVIRHFASDEIGRSRGHGSIAEDFAIAWRGSGEHQRRSEAGRSHPSQSNGAGLVWAEP